MVSQFDAIVIGTGQAGPSLAGRLCEAGMRVAIIERHRFGGTCVNTGCIPTKTMIASAYVAQTVRRARTYGVNLAGDMTVDMRAIKARKDSISESSSRDVESRLRNLKGVTVLVGTANFQDATTVSTRTRCGRTKSSSMSAGGPTFLPCPALIRLHS